MAMLPSPKQQKQKADAAGLDPTPPPPAQNAADDGNATKAPAVRFASVNQEISADNSVNPLRTTSSTDQPQIDERDVDQLKELSKSLQGGPLQQRRMNTYQFEAFSLPPSRVPSRDENTPDSTRLSTPSSPGPRDSLTGSPRFPVTSPPLTPYGSEPSVADKRARQSSIKSTNEPSAITPQPSVSNERLLQHPPLTHRSASSDQIRRATSAEDHKADGDRAQSHRKGMFGGGASVPVSRESSPTRSSASNYYSKPMTPGGDVNDPYSKGKRPPQQQNANRSSIDARFLFSRKKKSSSPNSSKIDLSEKRNSGSWGPGKTGSDESATPVAAGHQHHHASSMVDLKRFFRKSGHHHHQHHQKRDTSPAASVRTGTKTPPTSRQSTQQHTPFADDHGLSTKYGKLGKVLGAGAGGSVRLMKRKEDGTVFAVKEFRARHAYETEREYNKKVTAEFCVGSTLHHGNIIETLDILQEKGRWYEVMEYAPFDLFAIVMTGRMTREEVTCCFLQILNGVTYLHSLGLAHRDLKLDNVVVSDKGVMKIIDFGSAHVFNYPFESQPVPAKGIVGSDPYLAPEVYETKEYEASAVDIWSLAIIYCCMTLRRFPWKLPRMSDNSFKLFASEPTPGHDPDRLLSPSSSENSDSERKSKRHHTHHHHHHHSHSHSQSQSQSRATTNDGSQPSATTTTSSTSSQPERKEVIRGPWRILRLLPRDSRKIIWRMLDLNPKTRATMDDILSESWIADTIICQQIENGEVIQAEDHTHILEPPASQSAPSTKT